MARYGLPDHVEFCTRCVQSNQKVVPSIVQRDTKEGSKSTLIFQDGVCLPCRIHEAKVNSIDWNFREQELLKLLDRYRSSNGNWDCIVPGSGGKDSIFQAHILKTKYGMNPLTVTWAPHLYTDVGRRNFDRWIRKGGFDNMLFTPDGERHGLLTRLAFKNLFHPFQPFIFGQRNYVMHISRQLGIKLIFFGENPAEYGGFRGEEDSPKMSKRYYVDSDRSSMRISGLSLDELKNEKKIDQYALRYYLPLTEEEYSKFSPAPHWLGYYVNFHPQSNYYYAQEHVGFETNDQRTEGTYSRYNSIDDKLDGFHYWCGYIKFGIGRATHEASQEIRNGDLTREEGVSLVRKYDGEFPARYFKEILEYIQMDEEEFFNLADSFRPEHLWVKSNSDWQLRHRVS
ncbi:N-acetyl sugar amidotransferase [Thiorhodococcus drewsii AZ1]|uniref:N-acetyl sugar amidotransferase n=1 Tax=Thiorhodococcus drewsii AZ1 TaxID=765913 RepID=G2E7F6_9GAMM|nr:N-acetyl sugar amidotransferase [Thiorhodococcus drewsii]EGV27995.1 N-acetyl sugar amidotransferase [Thiorhodococcus drewsii AZ1]